jgi:hypothetical protein
MTCFDCYLRCGWRCCLCRSSCGSNASQTNGRWSRTASHTLKRGENSNCLVRHMKLSLASVISSLICYLGSGGRSLFKHVLAPTLVTFCSDLQIDTFSMAGLAGDDRPSEVLGVMPLKKAKTYKDVFRRIKPSPPTNFFNLILSSLNSFCCSGEQATSPPVVLGSSGRSRKFHSCSLFVIAMKRRKVIL